MSMSPHGVERFELGVARHPRMFQMPTKSWRCRESRTFSAGYSNPRLLASVRGGFTITDPDCGRSNHRQNDFGLALFLQSGTSLVISRRVAAL
jgi:hypothetical protein